MEARRNPFTYVLCHSSCVSFILRCKIDVRNSETPNMDTILYINYVCFYFKHYVIIERRSILMMKIILMMHQISVVKICKEQAHFLVAYDFVREQVMAKEIELQHVSSRECVADIFTKALGKDLYMKHRTHLGVVSKSMLDLVEEGV